MTLKIFVFTSVFEENLNIFVHLSGTQWVYFDRIANDFGYRIPFLPAKLSNGRWI